MTFWKLVKIGLCMLLIAFVLVVFAGNWIKRRYTDYKLQGENREEPDIAVIEPLKFSDREEESSPETSPVEELDAGYVSD